MRWRRFFRGELVGDFYSLLAAFLCVLFRCRTPSGGLFRSSLRLPVLPGLSHLLPWHQQRMRPFQGNLL